jgi:hypothetical protein
MNRGYALTITVSVDDQIAAGQGRDRTLSIMLDKSDIDINVRSYSIQMMYESPSFTLLAALTGQGFAWIHGTDAGCLQRPRDSCSFASGQRSCSGPEKRV